MVQEFKLPSGHLGMFPVVRMDPEMKGEHHEAFLASSDNMFERTMASVIGSLIQVGDVQKIALIDLVYLFFIIRTASVSPVYKTEWRCRKTVTPKAGMEQECGHTNTFSLNVARLDTKFVPKNYEPKKFDVTVTIPKSDTTVSTKVTVRFLTVSEEITILDDLAAEGITRDKMGDNKNAYALIRNRLLQALVFDDAKVNSLSLEEKAELLKAMPFSLVNGLLAELKALDSFGTDVSAHEVTCEKCKGVSKLSIPFSGQFFLS